MKLGGWGRSDSVNVFIILGRRGLRQDNTRYQHGTEFAEKLCEARARMKALFFQWLQGIFVGQINLGETVVRWFGERYVLQIFKPP